MLRESAPGHHDIRIHVWNQGRDSPPQNARRVPRQRGQLVHRSLPVLLCHLHSGFPSRCGAVGGERHGEAILPVAGAVKPVALPDVCGLQCAQVRQERGVACKVLLHGCVLAHGVPGRQPEQDVVVHRRGQGRVQRGPTLRQGCFLWDQAHHFLWVPGYMAPRLICAGPQRLQVGLLRPVSLHCRCRPGLRVRAAARTAGTAPLWDHVASA
mmetsp:Transcript_4601/g.11824  ORF Transcript_4601/g.11824 Transcript_4601/m.11824 type:complete len:211 (+) Transcript_4601:416-1048(+)